MTKQGEKHETIESDVEIKMSRALFGWLLVLIYVLYVLPIQPSIRTYITWLFFHFVQDLQSLAQHSNLPFSPTLIPTPEDPFKLKLIHNFSVSNSIDPPLLFVLLNIPSGTLYIKIPTFHF